VFAGGISILVEVLAELGIKELVTTQGALREGILYDLVGRWGDEDSRMRTVRAMERRYHIDTEQASRVELTAVSLLGQVADAWKLDQPNVRNLLGWAARLHEIGLDIAHAHYHKHGAYLLENADMPGFNRSAQRILACVVGAHRRKLTNANIGTIAPKGWAKRATRLAILLRLAVLFNRGRSYDFPEVLRISAKENSLTLCLPSEWLDSNPLSLADLENERGFLSSAGYELEFIPLEDG